jgi:hypothetical protein
VNDDDAPSGFLWSVSLALWLLGGGEDELAAAEVPAPEVPEAAPAPDDSLDPDAAIIVANLRDELRARDAEIAALRSQVTRPGYDPAKGAPVGERGPGRPRVVTPSVQAALLRAMRAGVTRGVACTRAGISKASLLNAMRADPVFKGDVARAELASIAAAEKSFARHARAGDDYKAAESYLKRRAPEVWALPSERVIAPNVAENRALKDDALASLVAALVGPVDPGEQTRAPSAPADDVEEPEADDGGEADA